MLVRWSGRLERLEKQLLNRAERGRGGWDYAALSDDELRRMIELAEAAGIGPDGGVQYGRLSPAGLAELRALEKKLVWRPG